MKHLRRIGKSICIVFCLTMLCACGVQPQQPEEPAQETVEQPAVSDIYELPLFDELPKEYSTIDPAFWVAESQNGGRVYLLGSIHVADETAYRLPQPIMDAYLESDALAVEVDTVSYADDEMAQKSDEERTTYPDGDTLRNHIDPLMYEQLQEYISSNTDDPQLLPSLENRMPCVWLSALTDIEDAAAGLSPELGIDQHFMQLAHEQGKEIIEIESSAAQYEVLNRIPDKAYEILFSTYIYETEDTAGDSLKSTYAAWKAGTLQASMEITGEEAAGDASGYAEAIAEYYRILFTERNTVMADAAKSYLDAGKKVFLTVGAEHLLGSSGVVAQLEADGYHLSPLGGAEGKE